MITAVLYGAATIVFANLLLASYIAGWEIGDRRCATEAEPRCLCRRYAFPSPLCPVHGRQAA